MSVNQKIAPQSTRVPITNLLYEHYILKSYNRYYQICRYTDTTNISQWISTSILIQSNLCWRPAVITEHKKLKYRSIHVHRLFFCPIFNTFRQSKPWLQNHLYYETIVFTSLGYSFSTLYHPIHFAQVAETQLLRT